MVLIRRFELSKNSGFTTKSRVRRRYQTAGISAQDLPRIYTILGNIEGCIQMLGASGIHPASGSFRVSVIEKLFTISGDVSVYSEDGERFLKEVLEGVTGLSKGLAEDFPTLEFSFTWTQNLGFGTNPPRPE